MLPPIVEKAGATSERPSAVDVEESLVLWHPSHVVAIWAASASEVMLQGLVALSLILWRPTLSEDGDACRAAEQLSFARQRPRVHRCVGELLVLKDVNVSLG